MLTTPESVEPALEPTWHAAGINVWTAEAAGDQLGSIEQTHAYGYIVKDSDGDWIASFSALSDAMWFLELAERLSGRTL